MLHVALTPAAVAPQVADQVRRRVLETPGRVGKHADRPTGPPKQCGFDKVMTEDHATQRRPTGQVRRPAQLAKARVRTSALCPRKLPSPPVHIAKPRPRLTP